MRGSRGSFHSPLSTLTYVGRFVVEKKPSGSTPSAGAGSKRAAGAFAKRGCEKSGARYMRSVGRMERGRNDACVAAGKVAGGRPAEQDASASFARRRESP